ncbi:MAG TPA: hypothetical protein VFU72_09220, partial [Nitrolancea sp.]|nr:hypothetical protein [Nitrolancea sp.]
MSGANANVSVNINGNSAGAKQAIQDVLEALRQLNNQAGAGRSMMSQYGFSWTTLGQSILGSLGPMGSWLVVAGSIVSLATPFIDAFQNAADVVVQFAEHLGMDLVQAAQAAAQEIENLTQQVMDLNVQTQKNLFTWSYLQGG